MSTYGRGGTTEGRRWGSWTSAGRSNGSMTGRPDGHHPSRKEQNVNSTPEYPPQPLGSLLTSISNTELTGLADAGSPPAKITDCEYVASYNWIINKGSPAILIPGKPPAWTPLQQPRQLREDRGDYFRDLNSARYPKYPTEPAVQAVLAERPDVSEWAIDLFACGSTVGNLLRFVRGIDKPFRFNVEAVGNTVFFVRKEKAPTELIPDVRGYGHTFPEAYTTWESDVKGSESHQRIIKYTFNTVNCMIRFESDGYHGDLGSSAKPRQSRSSVQQAPDAEGDLTSVMEATSFGFKSRERGNSDRVLQIQLGGRRIPQSAIFDLKTRSSRREIDMAEIYPRLWVSQIPNFIIGYHTRGVFEDIREQDVSTDLRKWESENQDALIRLSILIQKILSYTKAATKKKLEIFRRDLDVLEIRVQAGDSCDVLPPDVKLKWTQGKESLNSSLPTAQEKGKNRLDLDASLDSPRGI